MPPETTAYAHESQPPFDAPPDAPVPPLTPLYLSSYLGASGADDIAAAAVKDGTYPRVFVGGSTSSADFPTTNDSPVDTRTQIGCSACPADAFVQRRDAPGDVVWSTVIGDQGFERVAALAIATDGDVFAAGSAASLPMTTNAADATFAGGSTAERGDEDGFVCRLDGETGAIEWCTFVGGNGSGGVTGLAYDANGDDVVVVMNTVASESLDGDAAYNAGFSGRHRATAQGADTVAIRISGDGTTFEWATYVGGSGDESASPSVALVASAVHVLTTTSSTDAPTPSGHTTAAPAGRNAYLASFSADGTMLRYGTYLGGAGDDWTAPHALVDAVVVYAAVNTTSADMPTRNAAQATYGGGGSTGCGDGDGWVGAIIPSTSGAGSFVSGTYVGGSRGDEIGGLTVTGAGEVVVSGRTYSSDFPTAATHVPFQAMLNSVDCTSAPGNSDGFLVQYLAGGSAPLSARKIATYLGGAVADHFAAAASPYNGAFFVLAGATASTNFPVRQAFQTTRRGESDGVLVVPEYWRAPGEPVVDAGTTPDALGNFDASSAIDEGGGGCCGASDGRASSAAMALVVLALVAARRRATSRDRRAAAGTA